MGGNSGGGGGGTTVVQNKPSDMTAPYMQQLLDQAATYYSTPQTQYMGQTIADQSDLSKQAIDMTQQWATNSTPDVLAGRQQITDTASGKYQGTNPYMNAINGIATGQTQNNPFINAAYTNNVINDTAGNMAQAHATGTAAQNAALANMQGAFGGSGYIQKQSADAAGLDRNIGQMANQYQLAQQTLGANDYRQGLAQQMQAAGMGQQDFNAERARQMQAAGMAPQLQNMDLQASQALAGAGSAQEGYQQQLLSGLYNQWQQGQQAPGQQLTGFANLLAQANGGAGGSSTTNSTVNGGGFNPWGMLAGVGMGAYGLNQAGLLGRVMS